MDYYELLGVARTASADEIKSSYRKLALKFHPDRNKEEGAAEKFAQINEAYAVLSDTEKRAHYDRFGSAPGAGMPGGDPFGGMGGAGFDPMDIFEQLFGGAVGGMGARGRRGPARGDDIDTEAHINLLQARAGEEVEVDVDRLTTCEHCHGSKTEPGGKPPAKCTTCRGSGAVRAQARTIFGVVETQQVCPTCKGEGELIVDPCTVCKGRGRTLKAEKVKVKLPKGIDEGYRIRVANMGNEGPGGNGDLYVHIEMEAHPELRREAEHLIYPAKIGFATAAMGGDITVPTLDGPQPVEVKAGTQHGELYRLKGQGMPRLQGSGNGDLIVEYDVIVPKPSQLNEQAREALKAYAAAMGDQAPHEKHESFFDKVGKIFRGD
ncbi:molecular chaperone DnaJ [Deinococcus sp.]|uniref:molecular chaperone DnaJ n=1 Tax=Deinococcus sp. TaxID=47478 RepID=UPI0025BAA894|nr:molecular chaperone DnaJ [Deinococcus sp.]